MTSKNLHEIPVALDIGIAEIDAQHRQLHALLERLKQSTDKRYGFAADAILAELVIQTRIHFAVEESLMRLLSFPDTEAHVEEHRKLTDQLEKLRKKAQDFEVADGRLDITVSGTTATGTTPSRDTFSWMVLSALVDDVTATVADTTVTLTMRVTRSASVGA